MPQIGYAHRQAPMARDGMVASCHPLASLAGVEVLKSGGTVADAAVATNAVLAVTQPNYCGLGGDLFCLYYEAATRRVHFLNGAGRSGSRAGLQELGRRGLSTVPMIGPGSVSVPGVTRAWRMLLERFGTRGLKTLLDPAIHYARDGSEMEIQEAIERPRFVCGPLDPGAARDTVRIEGRVPAEVRDALARRGHQLEVVSDWFARMGHAHGIALHDGTLRGGADPRGDGAAIGY